MFDLMIKNGQVVTAEKVYSADVCVKDETNGKIFDDNVKAVSPNAYVDYCF